MIPFNKPHLTGKNAHFIYKAFENFVIYSLNHIRIQ